MFVHFTDGERAALNGNVDSVALFAVYRALIQKLRGVPSSAAVA